MIQLPSKRSQWESQVMRFGAFVAILALASHSKFAHAGDGAASAISSGQRAIVIRYDSQLITLSSPLLRALLDQPETLAEIGENVLEVRVTDNQADPLGKQPPGVFVGFIDLALSEKADSKKLMQSAQRVIQDRLYKRVVDSSLQSLGKQINEYNDKIEGNERTLASVQKQLGYSQGVGSAEQLRSIAQDIRRRSLELKIQDQIALVRSEVLERNLRDLQQKKSKAADRLRSFEKQVASLLERRTSSESKRNATKPVEASKMQVNLSLKHSGATAELQMLVSEARESYAELARRYSDAAKTHNAHELEANVQLQEQQILAKEEKKITQALAEAQEKTMGIQSRIDSTRRDLNDLYKSRSEVKARRNSIRKVTVEIW